MTQLAFDTLGAVPPNPEADNASGERGAIFTRRVIFSLAWDRQAVNRRSYAGRQSDGPVIK